MIQAEPLWPLLSVALSALAFSSRPRTAGEEVSDEELVDRARQGDPRAMQDLYQRYADIAYRRLTHLVGPDPEREDVLQEVFMGVMRGLGSFRGDASFRTYVYRIVTNKAYDHLRKRRKRAESFRNLGDALNEMESHAPSPEQQTQSSSDAVLFRACLDDLKPKKRIAFILRVAEGLSLKEIAEQVGATVPTVAQRIRHARMELSEAIQQREQEVVP